MSNLDKLKKPVAKDWHPADIKAALEKRGWSLSRLSNKHDYCRTAASLALHMPWPKMERLIAAAIDERPQAIWPSRYNEDGSPKSGRGERGRGRYRPKNTTADQGGNVEVSRENRHGSRPRSVHG